MALDTQISNISPEQLDALFQDVPTTTPTANDLVVGKENPENPIVKNTQNSDIPNIDFDALEKEAEENDKKKTEVVVDDKTKQGDSKPEDKKDDAVVETSKEIKDVLKNTVDYLIKSGLWNDFEKREEIEFDEKTYAELAAAQQQAKVEEQFNELLDSTGDYGKAIIGHIKNGGNPEDVIDIFKEQKQIQAIDTKTEEGKIELVGKYYSEIIGWKPEKVRKHLKNLLEGEEGDLDSEVEDVEKSYNEYHAQQLAEINRQTEQAKQAEIRKQETFKTNIKSTLSKREDLTDKEKRTLEKSILDFKHKLQNGTVVNDFYIKFAEMQSDPQQYIDLVQFVTDKKAYDEKLIRNLKTDVSKNSFNFIKGNNAVKKTGSPNNERDDQNGSSKIDFSSLLRKK
jgi:hypothetical protein